MRLQCLWHGRPKPVRQAPEAIFVRTSGKPVCCKLRRAKRIVFLSPEDQGSGLIVDKMRTSLKSFRPGASIATLVLAVAATSAGETSQRVFATNEHPGTIPIPTRIGEVWVAGSELVGRSGRPDLYQGRELLGRDLQEHFENEFDNPSPDCLHMWGGTYGSHAGAPDSFEELVTRSQQILRGEVTGAAGGFFLSTAGLLMQVRVIDWIKRNEVIERIAPDGAEFVHFFYPSGNFNVGQVKVCGAQAHMPPPPSIGDEVLLFPLGQRLVEYPEIIFTSSDGSDVVLEGRHTVRVPRTLFRFEELRWGRSIADIAGVMAVINLVNGQREPNF